MIVELCALLLCIPSLVTGTLFGQLRCLTYSHDIKHTHVAIHPSRVNRRDLYHPPRGWTACVGSKNKAQGFHQCPIRIQLPRLTREPKSFVLDYFRFASKSCLHFLLRNSAYSRVAQSHLPTPAPGCLRISARPQMEGGRLGEGPGKVFMGFYIRKHSQNIANIGANHCQKSVKISGKLWKSGLVDR